ncbi:hypothetical protein DSO57_1022901 [Entomophthora muscae]|uniref:Uncharacterized protein n=1 Tax=Entomophthora muscae TaxID=34485 RepID=A0ACC2U1B5_9FUNG|nr:hypothetical protein DSO57_1022901 [Entomophthora muscae]
MLVVSKQASASLVPTCQSQRLNLLPDTHLGYCPPPTPSNQEQGPTPVNQGFSAIPGRQEHLLTPTNGDLGPRTYG